MSLEFVAIALGAYLIGSFPAGVLVARLAHVEIRSAGSGNIGATNVARTAGGWFGALTLILDIAKGALPVIIAQSLATQAQPIATLADPRIVAGAAAFAGHLFPPALGFRGGKGVATALGVIGALAPGVLLVPGILFAFLVGLTRQVSLGSVSAALICPIAAQAEGYPPPVVVLLAGLGAAILFRHGDNLARLRAGTEPRL
jgi:glycerol-3-phosphate acyltransferase PlsY